MDENNPNASQSQPTPTNWPTRSSRQSGLAVASLSLGIASFFCFSIIASIPAVICGHLAQKEIRESNGYVTGQGMATVGLVLGYANFAFTIIVILLSIFSVWSILDLPTNM
jgi:hypothetical protein